MSQVDIERFYEIAQNSEELQNLLGDAEDRNSFVDTAVRLGAEHGCNFTIEEANAFLDTKKGDVELSDQELEAVAGGRRRINWGRVAVGVLCGVLSLLKR